MNSWQEKLRSLLKRLPDHGLLMGLAAAVGALLFFAWLANEVLAGDTKNFDEQVRLLIHQAASPPLTVLMGVITMLGSAWVLLVFGSVMVCGFWLVGWRHSATLFLVTMAGAALLNLVLKLSFHRTRPAPYFDTPLPTSYSFPSGHAMLSLCFYGALAALVNARLASRPARLSLWLGATLLILLIGISRVYLGVHYPSDVLAGYAGALVWIMAIMLGDRVLQR